jgi:plastocyanin
VKTGTSTFEQACITLSKGATLKVVQDQTSYHILDYGQWNGTTAQPQSAPAGAPALKNLALSGPSVSIGPFTTAGTYHIYCTVHPNMNLTVEVK